MEALVVKAVARELRRELPARVQTVAQPSAREVVLVLRGATETRLLLSTDPEAPRLHLISDRPAVLPAPTAFCRLLRKRLEGAVLAGVESPGVERVVELVFAAPRGRGPAGLRLIAELMGKHSNLVLVDGATGVVIDSLQHVAPPLSRVRTVLPGLPYTPPPASGRLDLGSLEAPAFSALWSETGGRPEALFRRVLGLGPGMLALAVGRARLAPGYEADPGAAVQAALLACREEVERGETRPVSYPGRGVLLPLPVPGWESEPRSEALSMSAAAAEFYARRRAARDADRARDAIGRGLRRELKKLAAEQELRAGEAREGEESLFLQSAGTALIAAAAAVPRGSSSFEAVDPRTGKRREISLDPALGPLPNAAAIFRKARKLRRRAALAAEKLPGVVARRRLLEEELALIPTLPPQVLLERISANPVAPGRPEAASRRRLLPGIREYRSVEGWRILVGKSGSGNDRLTGRIAAPEDYWFHVRDFPGAHVVLKGAGGEPPEEAIREAGAVAAWHSGARGERYVDVAYTKRKNVRKVKGGGPGKVLLGEAATVRVRPGVPASPGEPPA